MLEFHLRWLELVAAAALRQGIGLVWYAPFAFGRSWARLQALEPRAVHRRARWAWPLDSLCALLIAFTLMEVLDFAGMIDALGGAVVGFLMWLGFVAAATSNRVLYGGQPVRLFLIDAGFGLTTLVGMGALIASWQWGDLDTLTARLGPPPAP